jgi:hypothetical protein
MKSQIEEKVQTDNEVLERQAITSKFHGMHRLQPSQISIPFQRNILNCNLSLPLKHNPVDEMVKNVALNERELFIFSEHHTSVSLATSMDKDFLNPLHCFVRRNVEFFVATKNDVSAPSPGRKVRVDIGQVGIRCIHCAKAPKKNRIKRAVCYPPSISGIYHCISNMKFDHFGSCMNLPEQLRVEFSDLRYNYNRRNSSVTNNGPQTMSCSTAQYYHDSAIRLGLRDSSCGIRYIVNNINAKEQVRREYTLDGIAALMLAAGNPYQQVPGSKSLETGIKI